MFCKGAFAPRVKYVQEVYVKSLRSRHDPDSSECKKMFIECRTSASLNSLANTRGIKPVVLREREKE
jgi:hypothetical protein